MSASCEERIRSGVFPGPTRPRSCTSFHASVCKRTGNELVQSSPTVPWPQHHCKQRPEISTSLHCRWLCFKPKGEMRNHQFTWPTLSTLIGCFIKSSQITEKLTGLHLPRLGLPDIQGALPAGVSTRWTSKHVRRFLPQRILCVGTQRSDSFLPSSAATWSAAGRAP